ncbi:Collagen alpha-1(XXV) chain [Varanus komodoensis]|nr:Collagen alpha-1(XXV) chain [Varanus komodoensis]
MSEPREKKAPAASPPGGCQCVGGASRAPVILSLLFSLLSVGACFLLSAKTSKLQGRLVALEEELASRAWSPGDQLGAEPLLAVLQPQVDDLLQEVRGGGKRREKQAEGGAGERAA